MHSHRNHSSSSATLCLQYPQHTKQCCQSIYSNPPWLHPSTRPFSKSSTPGTPPPPLSPTLLSYLPLHSLAFRPLLHSIAPARTNLQIPSASFCPITPHTPPVPCTSQQYSEARRSINPRTRADAPARCNRQTHSNNMQAHSNSMQTHNTVAPKGPSE